MGYADQIIADHFQRTGWPDTSLLDAAHQLQMTILRDLLASVEVSLTAEGAPPVLAGRVLRRTLSELDAAWRQAAEVRLREREAAVRQLMSEPPKPVVLADLSRPPQ